MQACTERLLDVKTYHLTKRNYVKSAIREPVRCAPIKLRGDKVATDYVTTARKIDRAHGGVAANDTTTVGPVEAKLASYGPTIGLAFGAFGEASPGVEALVAGIGDAIGCQDMSVLGEDGVDHACAVARWQIRRAWAMTHWRESARLMSQCLEHATPSGGGSAYAHSAGRAQERALWGNAHQCHIRMSPERFRGRGPVSSTTRSAWRQGRMPAPARQMLGRVGYGHQNDAQGDSIIAASRARPPA